MSDSLWPLPGSSVHGILQARILDWVVTFSSRGSSWPRDRTQKSPALQAGSLLSEPPVLCNELTVITPIGQMRKLRLREVRWLSWGWSQHVNPKPGPWTSGCPNSQWEGLQVIFPCTLPTCRVFFFLRMFWALHQVKSLSRVWLFATLWTVAHLAPLSTGFSRQEYWSGLPFPSPGGLLDPGIEPRSPALQADALTSEPPGNNFSYFTDDLHLSQWHSSLR